MSFSAHIHLCCRGNARDRGASRGPSGVLMMQISQRPQHVGWALALQVSVGGLIPTVTVAGQVSQCECSRSETMLNH